MAEGRGPFIKPKRPGCWCSSSAEVRCAALLSHRKRRWCVRTRRRSIVVFHCSALDTPVPPPKMPNGVFREAATRRRDDDDDERQMTTGKRRRTDRRPSCSAPCGGCGCDGGSDENDDSSPPPPTAAAAIPPPPSGGVGGISEPPLRGRHEKSVHACFQQIHGAVPAKQPPPSSNKVRRFRRAAGYCGRQDFRGVGGSYRKEKIVS